MRKNIVNPISGKIPSELLERGVSSRWSIEISTVTVGVVMWMGDERRWRARICFGVSFSPKIHHLNRSHCRELSLFFSPPDTDNYQCQFMPTHNR